MFVVASTITQESSSPNSCDRGKTMGKNNSQLLHCKNMTFFFPQKKAHR